RAHGNDSPAAVNTATVIDDIATNLCIPSDRVERVVNGLIEQGIGQRQGNDMFAIADTAILDALVRRAAQQQSVEVAADRPGLMGEGVPDKPGDAVGGHKLDGILQTLRSQL
ncbi:MAG: hypothetical protein RL120_14535, partial [Gammaproteobacteria bacterium]